MAGFVIRVVMTGGAVAVVRTTTEVARKNIVDSSRRPTWTGAPLTKEDLVDRDVLHEALGALAADVLLLGSTKIRTMQDVEGNWWNFRSDHVTAVEVIDEERPTQAPTPIGFRFED